MITDLFAGSNQNLNLSAMIASSSAKAKNMNELDNTMSNNSNSIDFATLLSQTIDSGFGIDSEDESVNINSVLFSSDSSSKNLSLSDQLISSFSSDSFNSSPFVNLTDRNSFQSSPVVTNDTKTSSEKEAVSNTEKTNDSEDDEKANEEEGEEKVDSDQIYSQNLVQPVMDLESNEVVATNNSDIEIESVEATENLEVSEKVAIDTNIEKNIDDESDISVESELAAQDEEELAVNSESTEVNLPTESSENLEASSNNQSESDSKENDSKIEEIVEELKDSESPIPEESLRQKFAESTGQDKNSEAENVDNNMSQQGSNDVVNQTAQANAINNSSNNNSIKNDFSELTTKSESLNAKSDPSKIVIGNSEGTVNKGFTMGQNNGSGTGNGFSFHSGVNQTYNENGKLSQATNSPATAFSELLTKAEMVQTKDGAKVMNLEVEQEGMGKLELELTSKDGEVTARLSAESDLAKAKLEELAPQIKENLLEKGVNLTEINVDVSSKNADENGDKYLNTGKRNKSKRINGIKGNSVKELVEKKILPNLRRVALNIQSVDLTV